jgi:hypothetical protein
MDTVLEAGLSYQPGWENRLTAIFATVLDQHDRFASAMFELLGLPTGERYEAYTEVWVTPTRRVDMQVIAKNAANGDVAQVWSEHKRHGGAFSSAQREDYLAALERHGGGRLVTIIADLRDDESSDESSLVSSEQPQADELPVRSGEASPTEPRWWGLDWQLIAELAYGVGETEPGVWGGRAWQGNALKPDAPAAHRALYELVWYLEEEDYAVVEPLSAEHVVALKHLEQTVLAATTVLKRAGDEMTSLVPDGDVTDYGDGFGQSFELPPESWVQRLGGTAEIIAYSDDGWIDSPRGEPSLAVGVSLDADWYRPLSARTEWVGRVRAAGFSFSEYGEDVLIYVTRPLEDIVSHGRTMGDQARFVARWAEPHIQQALGNDFDPGLVERPPKPKRGRSAP